MAAEAEHDPASGRGAASCASRRPILDACSRRPARSAGSSASKSAIARRSAAGARRAVSLEQRGASMPSSASARLAVAHPARRRSPDRPRDGTAGRRSSRARKACGAGGGARQLPSPRRAARTRPRARRTRARGSTGPPGGTSSSIQPISAHGARRHRRAQRGRQRLPAEAQSEDRHAGVVRARAGSGPPRRSRGPARRGRSGPSRAPPRRANDRGSGQAPTCGARRTSSSCPRRRAHAPARPAGASGCCSTTQTRTGRVTPSGRYDSTRNAPRMNGCTRQK